MRPMSEKEILAAALSDPDARPFSRAQLARMKHTPRAKLIRRVLGLTQEEFARAFAFPSARCAIASRASKRAGPGRASLFDSDRSQSRSRGRGLELGTVGEFENHT
jgi:hypothetical protein